MLKLTDLNAMTRADFTHLLGSVFEHSPWVAERGYDKRPFETQRELHGAMCETVENADNDEKLALIRAHPDLVGRAVLTNESQAEQTSAGLSDLSANEVTRFEKYNHLYKERFGFPFVICARLNKKDTILSAFPQRLEHSRQKEIETALAEICKIAELRLRDLVQ